MFLSKVNVAGQLEHVYTFSEVVELGVLGGEDWVVVDELRKEVAGEGGEVAGKGGEVERGVGEVKVEGELASCPVLSKGEVGGRRKGGEVQPWWWEGGEGLEEIDWHLCRWCLLWRLGKLANGF